MKQGLVGIHMIVQNEEHYLPRCLGSFQSLASECFVTDTGSVDRTVEIARQHQATVLHAKWDEDFASARNISLPLACTDWILCVDADEYAIQGMDELLAFLPTVEPGITKLRVTIINRIDEQEQANVLFQPVRLFRAGQGYRYNGRIHEQLVRGTTGDKDMAITMGASLESELPTEIAKGVSAEQEPLAPLVIMHDGYLPSAMATGHKPRRNLKLLQKQLAEQPDHPFHLYNLGVTYCQLGQLEKATEAFAQSLQSTPLEASYRPTLVRDYAKVLIVLERYDEAHGLLAVERQRYWGYADLHVLFGETLEQQGLEERAYQVYAEAVEYHTDDGTPENITKIEWQGKSDIAKTAQSEPAYVIEQGSATYKPYTAMGRLAQRKGFLQEAAQLYRIALAQMPTYTPAWKGLADVLQQSGESDERIAEQLKIGWKDQWKDQLQRVVIEADRDITEVVQALASCGAYEQALHLLQDQDRNHGISEADFVHWMLCANRVSEVQEWAERKYRDRKDLHVFKHSELKMDWAVACWSYGSALSPSFLTLTEPEESSRWRALDRLIYDRSETRTGIEIGTRTERRIETETDTKTATNNGVKVWNNTEIRAESQLKRESWGQDKRIIQRDEDRQKVTTLQVSADVRTLAKTIIERAVQTGQLSLAKRLHLKIAELYVEPHERLLHKQWVAEVLYQAGYTMAAAEMLIQCMGEGEIQAQSLFILGETLYTRGHYDQALALFQQALEQEPGLQRARAGASLCYLQLATEVMKQEMTRSPSVAELTAQLTMLEQKLRLADGLPWRTVFHAKERRNHVAKQSHFAMHDRQG
ncbi:tetratricopeptide repeat-containing glycosyltransferase [Paenibacillus xylanexedens]|uniref:tetratricopeptide repeat-containing glycosyltransferase n=1 Tax=Paenibacillus xylanexedens TaxID=528191 RepID=UPI001642B8C6|nr:tetratricopeptide repeat protein [Paenibacillus xylanexedens]